MSSLPQLLENHRVEQNKSARVDGQLLLHSKCKSSAFMCVSAYPFIVFGYFSQHVAQLFSVHLTKTLARKQKALSPKKPRQKAHWLYFSFHIEVEGSTFQESESCADVKTQQELTEAE